MGFIFRKCDRQRRVPIGKAAGEHAALLRKLREFLNAEEPRTMRWLISTWGNQRAVVTYKELREAILNGDISITQLQKWQQDYTELINTKLAPQWEKAMAAAAKEKGRQYPGFLYDPTVGAAQDYIYQRGAELITALTITQHEAIRAMISQASHYEAITPDALARIIRPTIGLTKPQAVANLNYYNSTLSAIKEAHPRMTLESATKKAREAAARYAGRQHRYRAQSIARTELAMAYNEGADGAVRDAQQQGFMGATKKVWVTADDERTCPECGGLEGEAVAMDAKFSNGADVAPAHPGCRCAVDYQEIEPGETLPDKVDTGAFEWIETASPEDREAFLGGKLKAQMYDGGYLPREDYFKPLKDVNPEARMRFNLDPPTDTFIEKLSQEQNVDNNAGFGYTVGKVGAERYYYDNSKPIHPPNNGVRGLTRMVTLKKTSMALDRFGGETGRYVSPRATPFEKRALPRTVNTSDYREYSIKKDIHGVESGTVAPWFGQPGGGLQYRLPKTIKELTKKSNGTLERIKKKADKN